MDKQPCDQPDIHPARSCFTCAHLEEDRCQNGFPTDALSCTEHQTETESEFFIYAASRAPIVMTFRPMGWH